MTLVIFFLTKSRTITWYSTKSTCELSSRRTTHYANVNRHDLSLIWRGILAVALVGDEDEQRIQKKMPQNSDLKRTGTVTYLILGEARQQNELQILGSIFVSVFIPTPPHHYRRNQSSPSCPGIHSTSFQSPSMSQQWYHSSM